MYTIEKRYLLKLGGTVDPVAAQSADIPLVADEALQHLSVWVYTPAGIALGGGTLDVKRNGVVVSTTPFAGNSIVVPVGMLTVGADVELAMLQPATTSRRKMDSVWLFDGVAMVEDKQVVKYDQAPRNMPVSFQVTNTDVAKKDLVLLWNALVWRNT